MGGKGDVWRQTLGFRVDVLNHNAVGCSVNHLGCLGVKDVIMDCLCIDMIAGISSPEQNGIKKGEHRVLAAIAMG